RESEFHHPRQRDAVDGAVAGWRGLLCTRIAIRPDAQEERCQKKQAERSDSADVGVHIRCARVSKEAFRESGLVAGSEQGSQVHQEGCRRTREGIRIGESARSTTPSPLIPGVSE